MSDAQEGSEVVASGSVLEKKPRKKWSYYSRKKLSRTRKRLIAEGVIKYTTGRIVNGNGGAGSKEKQDIAQTVKDRIRQLRTELRTLKKFQESLKETGIARLLR
jgi:hypothetical protein